MFDSITPFESRRDHDSDVRSDFDQSNAFPTLLQRTLKNAISCSGVGLHSGAKVSMVLNPAKPGTGVVFRRTDIAGQGAMIPARWDHVTDTRLNTCISNQDGVGVRTIEHLMAALSGAGVDNAIIDINGPEAPVMDGSAFPFLFLIECAGIVEQNAPRQAIRILKKIVVTGDGKSASLTPSLTPTFKVAIDFPASVIGAQEYVLPFSEQAFRHTISRARTFGFEQDVLAMRSAGLGRGGSLENAVVIAADGSNVLNEDGLRFEDEFVRHKILDAVGDLYLAGAPILGAYAGVRPGHAMNNQLLRALFADQDAWEMVPMADCALALSGIAGKQISAAFG